MREIRRNHQQITQMRSELNEEYGRLERYILVLGNNPRKRDGVNPEYYFVYHNAFSSDILLRVGPSVDAVIQDLDYIMGKLNGMTEDGFREAMHPSRQESIPAVPSRNYWHITNPLWWLWELAKWIWQHKLISIVIAAVGLLAVDYSLAWQNAIWLTNFVLRILQSTVVFTQTIIKGG